MLYIPLLLSSHTSSSPAGLDGSITGFVLYSHASLAPEIRSSMPVVVAVPELAQSQSGSKPGSGRWLAPLTQSRLHVSSLWSQVGKFDIINNGGPHTQFETRGIVNQKKHPGAIISRCLCNHTSLGCQAITSGSLFLVSDCKDAASGILQGGLPAGFFKHSCVGIRIHPSMDPSGLPAPGCSRRCMESKPGP